MLAALAIGAAPALFAPVARAEVVCGNTSGYCIGDGSAVVPAGVTVQGEVHGGPDAPWGSTVTNYSVTVYGSVGQVVYGGSANGGTVTYNTVTISGGSVGGGVYGGRASGGTASHNTVIISGGSVGYATGGYAPGGTASDNTVIISGGSVSGNVAGGYTEGSDKATNNTVRIAGTPNLSSATLYGGMCGLGSCNDVSTGNTLEMEVNKLQVAGVDNFENIKFTLPAGTAAGDTVLTVTNPVALGGVNISVDGSIPTLASGQKLTLISHVTGTLTPPSLPAGYEAEVDNGALIIKRSSTPAYPITPVATPTVGGEVDCGATEVAPGGSVTCTAKAKSDYVYNEDSIRLASGSATVASCGGATCTLTNVTSAVTVSASFTKVAKTHNITATASPAGSGSITCTPSTVEDGKDVTITCTAAPSSGYTLGGLSLNGGSCGSTTTCTATAVARDLNVSATFTPITVPTHAITATSGGNGSIFCTPTEAEEGKGVTITCTATPDSGYRLRGLSLPGGICSGTTCIAANVTGPLAVSAEFTSVTGPHAIKTEATPAAGGSVDCGAASVASGGSVTCTAKVNAGYTYVNDSIKLKDGSASVACSGDTCTLSNVTSDVTVSARFSRQDGGGTPGGGGGMSFTVTGDASTGGWVICAPLPVPQGGGTLCAAQSDEGYVFAKDMDVSPAGAARLGRCITGGCEIGNVQGNVRVTGKFKRDDGSPGGDTPDPEPTPDPTPDPATPAFSGDGDSSAPAMGELGLLLSGLALAGAAAPALRRRRKQGKKSDTHR